MTFIDRYTAEIQRLCSKHKVKRLYAFGSVLTDKFKQDSDVDLIVDFEPLDVNTYADNYFNFKFALEDTLHRPVDLLEDKAIKIHILEKQLKTSADLFMDIELKTWLYDILSALHEIETFTSNTSDFSAYQSDL